MAFLHGSAKVIRQRQDNSVVVLTELMNSVGQALGVKLVIGVDCQRHGFQHIHRQKWQGRLRDLEVFTAKHSDEGAWAHENIDNDLVKAPGLLSPFDSRTDKRELLVTFGFGCVCNL